MLDRPKMVERPPTGDETVDMLMYSFVASGYALDCVDLSVSTGAMEQWKAAIIDRDKVREATRGRVAHALKRLKSKGLWSDSYFGLRSLCEHKWTGVPFAAMCIATLSVSKEIYRTPISDEVWMNAIDLTMFLTEREAFLNIDCKYGNLLEPHLDVLYASVCLIYNGKSVYDMAEQYINDANAAKTRADFLTSMLQPAIDDATDGIAKRDHEIESLKQQVETLKKQIVSLEKKEAAGRKDAEIRKLTEEADGLRAQLRDKDRELDQVRAESDHYLEMIQSGGGPELPELPAYDVVFVGGHVNLTKKLKQVYPGWRFISGTDYSYNEFQRAACVFLYCGHMAHTVYNKLRDSLPDDIPMLYIDGINLDRLDTEMRIRYGEWLAKKAEST